MRRYTVTVGGRSHVVDVEELSADRFRVVVGGRPMEVGLSASEDLAEAVISPEITPDHVPRTGRPVPPEALEPILAGDGFRPELTAPMPGVVVSVQVVVGERVERGQVLLKLEAMKMSNAIRAPQDGLVAAVRVAPGQSVGYGDVLLDFERP